MQGGRAAHAARLHDHHQLVGAGVPALTAPHGLRRVKAAIVNFTKALGQQLVDRGIRVNSVAPGPVWTPLIPATMPEDKLESFGAQSPLGRAAQPAELAPFYVFLASQESSYMTAEVLGVTGGSPIT